MPVFLIRSSRSQSSRREEGSIPLVGSSRKETGEEPILQSAVLCRPLSVDASSETTRCLQHGSCTSNPVKPCDGNRDMLMPSKSTRDFVFTLPTRSTTALLHGRIGRCSRGGRLHLKSGLGDGTARSNPSVVRPSHSAVATHSLRFCPPESFPHGLSFFSSLSVRSLSNSRHEGQFHPAKSLPSPKPSRSCLCSPQHYLRWKAQKAITQTSKRLQILEWPLKN